MINLKQEWESAKGYIKHLEEIIERMHNAHSEKPVVWIKQYCKTKNYGRCEEDGLWGKFARSELMHANYPLELWDPLFKDIAEVRIWGKPEKCSECGKPIDTQ